MQKSLRVLSVFALMGAFLVSCGGGNNNPSSSFDSSVSSEGSIDPYRCQTISAARDIATAAGSSGTSEKYTVSGKIKKITNATYGQMYIEDETGELNVYGVYDADGNRFDAWQDQPGVGDTITLQGILKTYNDEPEMDRATCLGFEKAPISEDDYVQKTLAEARDAEKGALVRVSGIVANKNVNSSKAAVGFWIVDGTSSMYVYDNVAAASVSIGNSVTVLGEKTYFVASSEASSAEKWGYQGASQIVSAKIIANDKGNNAIDYSWCEEKTVKQIVNTPITSDITSKAFKVNALVRKSQGDGFLNYYIDDIDGKTGSYVYTMANGSDLNWLEPFDGKICTVYLVAINAKSSASGCIWRFYPLTVSYDNYEIAQADIPDYVLEYHVKDEFKDRYTADPALELPTSVSSDLLGFENATVSYTSSDPTVIDFTEDSVTPEEGEAYQALRMHANKYGRATVTATATYGEHVATFTKEIVFEQEVEYETATVAEAIAADIDSEVIVKGVVAGGFTNQKAVFINDETGTIAVYPTDGETTTKELSVGDQVIFKGTRKTYKKDGSTVYGQDEIYGATLLANNYGGHSVSSASFITDKTIADVIEIAKDANTAQQKVYRCEAYVTTYTTQYSSTVELCTDTTYGSYLACYSSSATQYSWLTNAFNNTTLLTVDFMLCNANSKSTWKAVPIAATDGTVTVYNTYGLKA